MARMTATAVRDSFAEVVNRASYGGERIALERHGKTVATIIGAADLELLEALEDRIDLAVARKTLKEPRRNWDEVKTELGLSSHAVAGGASKTYRADHHHVSARRARAAALQIVL